MHKLALWYDRPCPVFWVVGGFYFFILQKSPFLKINLFKNFFYGIIKSEVSAMKMFYPNFIFERIWEIDENFLKENNIKALVLDVDNTLTEHGSQEICEKTSEWLRCMKESGVKLCILSNNTPSRIKPFAQKIGADFVCGTKPRKRDYQKALEILNLPPVECAGVGDQIFTDVLGANLSGLFSILTRPISKNETAFIKFKRLLEKPFLKEVKK